MTLIERMNIFETIDIYPVITEAFCAGRTSLDVCKKVLDGGVKIVQLREKEMSRKELYLLAEQYSRLTKSYNALFIMNDHLDIALSVAADGVHLGQEDFPVFAAKKMVPQLIIGVSTHSEEEAMLAEQQGASYINIGPIYSTQTKANVMDGLGAECIQRIATKVNIPFTVMGGIKKHHFRVLLDQGARHLAMVTEITEADNISERVRLLQDEIKMLG